jgi:hypothetical protein
MTQPTPNDAISGRGPVTALLLGGLAWATVVRTGAWLVTLAGYGLAFGPNLVSSYPWSSYDAYAEVDVAVAVSLGLSAVIAAMGAARRGRTGAAGAHLAGWAYVLDCSAYITTVVISATEFGVDQWTITCAVIVLAQVPLLLMAAAVIQRTAWACPCYQARGRSQPDGITDGTGHDGSGRNSVIVPSNG